MIRETTRRVTDELQKGGGRVRTGKNTQRDKELPGLVTEDTKMEDKLMGDERLTTKRD